MAARLELRPVKSFFRDSAAIQAIGTSGTIRSTHAVARELGLIETNITPASIESLIETVLEFDTTDDLALKGLSERRAQVWPGGLSILAELLNNLRIGEMAVSDGALREGLLYDLLGRLQHEDARERTVTAMVSRYQVDPDQAARVAATAKALYVQCVETWKLDDDLSARMLEWAARLHEIGLDISHDGYQRHGAYIAEHADMPGFPQAEQHVLATMIGSQRHRISQERLQSLPKSLRETALRLLTILRLAVLLNRSRSGTTVPEVSLSVTANSLSMGFDEEWMSENPLTAADLERERGLLAHVGYELNIE